MKPINFRRNPMAIACRILAGILSFTAANVFAGDGAIEFNQACVANGCFPGDEPGFPITITEPGSYILTGNLDVSGEDFPQNVTAIDVVTGTSGATIDLGGFTIMGPTSCTVNPNNCDPIGAGYGVDVDGVMVTVRNGKIRGMGADGVRIIGASGKVQDLTVEQCGGDGIQIAASGGTMAINNFVRENRLNGFFAGPQALLIGNVIYDNGDWGVDGASNTSYAHNVFQGNDSGPYDAGIQIDGNTCTTVLCP